MRMQVSEQGDEVFIELNGVAGRHQRILQALTQGPIGRGAGLGETALETTDISVRAGADEMHIRLKGRSGRMLEALAVYHYLRHALVEPGAGHARDATHRAGTGDIEADAGARSVATA